MTTPRIARIRPITIRPFIRGAFRHADFGENLYAGRSIPATASGRLVEQRPCRVRAVHPPWSVALTEVVEVRELRQPGHGLPRPADIGQALERLVKALLNALH